MALAADAFAVSVGVSLSQAGLSSRQSFRLAFHFGLFQFLMLLLGWMAGHSMMPFIQAVDHWVAFGLLVLIGGRMIHQSLKLPGEEIWNRKDPTRSTNLLMLSVAISLDAFAVGLSLAFLRNPVLIPAAVIGIVALGMSLLGIHLGRFLGRIAGRWAEFLGGVLLGLIAAAILLKHLR